MTRLIIIVAVMALAGCVGDECRIFSPIRGSVDDTAQTRSQVDIHNANGVGACGWRP